MIQVRLLFTDQCSGCEKAAKLLERLKPEFPDMHVERVNLLDYPQEAARYRLLATPGIVINGSLEFAGGVKEKDLRRRLEQLSRGR
ncbi:MAG: thioredoxin family protein [Chloroflexi bacterium]|nr:thioredoxin family protein [Chloroflexota bacterium]